MSDALINASKRGKEGFAEREEKKIGSRVSVPPVADAEVRTQQRTLVVELTGLSTPLR